MTIYRISPERAQFEMRRTIWRSVLITVIGSIVGAFIGGRSMFLGNAKGPDSFWFISMGFVTVFAALLVLKTTRRLVSEAYSSLELSVDGESVTKSRKNALTVSVPRSQVTRIEEFEGRGLRIFAAKRSSNIWVPWELEGYEQLKAELLSLPVGFSLQHHYWLRWYLKLALMCGLFVLQALTFNKYLSSAAALLISAWIFKAAFRHYPRRDLTTRRETAASLFISIWYRYARAFCLAAAHLARVTSSAFHAASAVKFSCGTITPESQSGEAP